MKGRKEGSLRLLEDRGWRLEVGGRTKDEGRWMREEEKGTRRKAQGGRQDKKGKSI
jgi:hypothetical protein